MKNGICQLLLFFLLLGTSCARTNNNNESAWCKNWDLSGADWIGTNNKLPETDSLFYEDHPSPIFRKEFTVKEELESAKLYITAAGYYRAGLNNQRIGVNYLEPAWTDFSKRIYFSEYDLSTQIVQGENCLGVTLGNGFYNPLPLKLWGRRNLRDALKCGYPEFIAKLVLKYKNEKIKEVVSNETWKYAYGPILKNSVYLGEKYDARKEIDGWNLVGFNDQQWQNSKSKSGPGGKLMKAFFPPIRNYKVIEPVHVLEQKDGKYLVDFGENFTGVYNIRLQGKEGQVVQFRLGERIYANGELNPMTAVAGQIKGSGIGGEGAPDIAEQADTYIFGKNPVARFQPEFTFHTFRYMEITGVDNTPDISNIQGLALCSDVKRSNRFSCSAPLLNSIQQATINTFLANLLSVQSDCAAREKFGYGGDLNATSDAFIYNFHMQDFYRKTVYDWEDAINDSVFVDTAPYVGLQYCGVSWESAFLITQFKLYLYYNDVQIVEELYDKDLKWMQKVARKFPDGLITTGLADHEALVPVPVELIGTCHYLECARVMKQFASIMKDDENEKRFEQLEEKLTKLLIKEFWKQAIDDKTNKQTIFAALIYYNLLPEDELRMAADSLVHAINEAPSGHFTTGIFGIKYIMEALSKTGHSSLVFDIINSITYPGWGFMIDNGATTIWETWKESDNTYSNCHPMFGSVTEWFYRWLGGIKPDPEYPGFQRFIISPEMPDGLDKVYTSYNSPHGKIVSNWKQLGKLEKHFEIEIPEGTTAEYRIIKLNNQQVAGVRNGKRIEMDPMNTKDSLQFFELGPGKYKILVSKLN